MPLSQNIQLVPLDFDRVRADLKRYLQAQNEFKDYNFEGSALSLLIDILAYDAYYHGWYTNFAINEVFLQTAQLRNSVVAAAKQVGYVPRSVTGSRVEVNITVSGLDPSEGLLVLPKYTPFQATTEGKRFLFYTLNDTTINPRGETTATFANVELCEGTLVTQTYSITSDNYASTGTTLRILNPNTDTSTLRVLVSTSSSVYEYTRATSAVTVDANANVYFLFETSDGNYEIQFGDGRLGRNLSIGQQVTISYLVSQGEASTGTSTFTYAGNRLGNVGIGPQPVTVTLVNPNIPAYGGAPRESVESIKRIAPYVYQTQGRVVTPDDARAILLSEVSGIDSLAVWGGEDHDPPTYGKLFLCLKPLNALRFGATQKNNIIRNILRPKSLPTVSYEAVDPDYLYIIADSEVRYSPASTALSTQELQNVVRLAIEKYARVQLGQFGSFFRYSQLSSAIDDAEVSIVSSTTNVLLEKRLQILDGIANYDLRFSNPIFRGLQFADATSPVVSLSSRIGTQLFSHVDEVGLTQKFCWIQNEGDAIHVYQTTPETSTRKVKSNVGRIDFETGRVTFAGFAPHTVTSSLTNELRIRVVPVNSDIAPVRDQIILLPPENVRITMVNDLLNRRNLTYGRVTAGGQLGAGA